MTKVYPRGALSSVMMLVVLALSALSANAFQGDTLSCMYPFNFYHTGDNPSCMATGDFNSDDKLDFVVANYGNDNLFLYLNEGRGRFELTSPIPSDGDQPNDVISDDFNSDGNPDLAVSNRVTSTVTVLLGNGDGTFNSNSVFVGGGVEPKLLASGDFNNDQLVDIAVIEGNFSQASTVSILLNDGDGTNFTVLDEDYDIVGSSDFAIVAAELTGDANLDLTISTAAAVYVFAGNGDGSFSTPEEVITNPRPPFVVADIDNDMDLDLVSKKGNFDLYVLLNNGSGEFDLQIQTLSRLFADIEAGDFDHDGVLDLVVTFVNSGNVFANDASVLRGNGDGSFVEGSAPDFYSGSGRLTVDDFNGDEVLDVALTNSSQDSVKILAGDGDGLFFAEHSYSIAETDVFGNNSQSLVKGDLNNDSIEDIVSVNFYGNSLSVFLGQAEGGLLPLGEMDAMGFPRAARIADVNGDNVADLVVANHFGGTFDVGLGIGDGTFESFMPTATAPGPSEFEMVDVNLDDVLDLVIANQYSSEVSVYTGNNDGTFLFQDAYSVAEGPRYLTSGDINQDGMVDFVVGGWLDSTYSILLANENGSFEITEFKNDIEPRSVELIDLNLDGALDLVILPLLTSDPGGIYVLIGDGSGTFGNKNLVSFSFVTDACFADMNGDSIPDLVANEGSNFSIRLGLGDGTFEDSISAHAVKSGSGITIADIDGDSDLDVVTNGQTTLSVMINRCALIGDVNLDGNVDLLDVAPFVNLIVSGDFQLEADINGDCSVNLLDVQPFIDLL